MTYTQLACGLLLALCTTRAIATEVCDIPPRYGLSATAQAIVRTTCNEHRLWYRPFIDRDGRIVARTEQIGSQVDPEFVAEVRRVLAN